MENKSQTDRHKKDRPHRTIRVEPENDAYVNEKTKNEKSDYNATVNLIIKDHREKALSMTLDEDLRFEQIQDCSFFEPIPNDSAYGRCRKEGFWKIVFLGRCTECKKCKLTNVPSSIPQLMSFLKQFSQLKVKKQELEILIAERKKEHADLDYPFLLDLKNEEIRKLTTSAKNLSNERDTLNSKVSDMENTLLERDKKIAILETDNAYKDELISKLSESELLSENDALHLELNQKIKLNKEYTLEINKLEALIEKDQQTLNDVISQTKKVFRDFNESVPAWMIALPFVVNVQKKIKDFEGYVQTITS